ncbi:hypothetical protein [Herbaspirillum sp. CF444]|uniref:hypothetical protein n=1 Tax=Herbaspirillum sp. CF444 TaxID=1144319 RepID=UPI0012F83A34|nr:hypothetical protein [Herbaspirillum sp. CF444]
MASLDIDCRRLLFDISRQRFMTFFRGQKIPTLVVFITRAAGLLPPMKTVN